MLIKERDCLKEEATANGCSILFSEYKIKRNQVKSRIQTDKKNYYKNILHDQSLNSKNVWKTVHDLLGNVNSKAPRQLRHQNKIINNLKIMAEVLNKIFKDKVRNLRNQTNVQPTINPADRLQQWLRSRQCPLPDFALKQI